MAKLSAVVDSLDAVPETARDLYVEQDGKFVLDADLTEHPTLKQVRSELGVKEAKERKTRQALEARFKDIDPDRYRQLLEEAEKREHEGKPDLEKVIEKRLKEFEEKNYKPVVQERDQFKAELRTLRLDDKVKAAALKAGVFPEDVDDVLVITKRYFDLDETGKIVVIDDDGDPAGKTPEQWFGDVFKQRKPKFFRGSDASGSGARAGVGGDGGTTGTITLTPDQASDHQAYQAALKKVNGDHSRIKVAL